MYFKSIFFVFLVALFYCQPVKASDDIDYIPEKFRFPKYDDIAHPPLEVEYQGQKGVVLFIREKINEEKQGNLKIYFLTDNNKELNKAFEIYSNGYCELVGSFIFKEKKTGRESIFILSKMKETWGAYYRYWELPLFIDDDGVLRALFFVGDDDAISRNTCIDDFEDADVRCEYSTELGLKKYLDKERNR